MSRQMHLVGHVCTGPTNHHFGSWRHPHSDAHQVLEASRYENIARLYEKGLFDGMFIVDTQFLTDLRKDHPSKVAQWGGQIQMLDPMLVLAVAARVTQHLGLAATISTTLNNAYRIARSLATLDHLSKGRAGWNIVTSAFDQEAQNYGYDHLPSRDERYARADETVEACLELWNSWEPGALRVDRQAGIFADPDRIKYIEYEGTYVRTRGSLTTPHSPQGHPVLMQAGGSERGLAFASRWADCVFTLQQEQSRMQAFYQRLKDQVISHGRSADECVIMPAIEVIVGDSASEAQEHADYLDSLATPEMGLTILAAIMNRDLSGIPLDKPLDQIDVGPNGPSGIGAYENLMGKFAKAGPMPSLGEAALLGATTWWSPRLVGSAEQVADHLQDMFESRCCDGFVVTQALSPGGIGRFVELVVPELQARGVYRDRYYGNTFRDNLRRGN